MSVFSTRTRLPKPFASAFSIGERGKVAMFLDSGDLDLAKPVRQAQADAADPGPEIEDPPAVGADGRRQKHRVGADPVAVRRLRDLHRLIQKMVMRDLHHRHVIGSGIELHRPVFL